MSDVSISPSEVEEDWAVDDYLASGNRPPLVRKVQSWFIGQCDKLVRLNEQYADILGAWLSSAWLDRAQRYKGGPDKNEIGDKLREDFWWFAEQCVRSSGKEERLQAVRSTTGFKQKAQTSGRQLQRLVRLGELREEISDVEFSILHGRPEVVADKWFKLEHLPTPLLDRIREQARSLVQFELCDLQGRSKVTRVAAESHFCELFRYSTIFWTRGKGWFEHEVGSVNNRVDDLFWGKRGQLASPLPCTTRGAAKLGRALDEGRVLGTIGRSDCGHREFGEHLTASDRQTLLKTASWADSAGEKSFHFSFQICAQEWAIDVPGRTLKRKAAVLADAASNDDAGRL